jgi:hypothetical protein
MDDAEFKRLYDELLPIIEEELHVAFAMGRFGRVIEPSVDNVALVAGLIADEVVIHLRLAPKSN